MWTDERQALLEKRAADGKSFQDVADELDITRGAVAGRAHRTGVRFSATCGIKQLGERNHQAKLSARRVRALRGAPRGEVGELAREFGVCAGTASAVRSGKTWAHVSPSFGA